MTNTLNSNGIIYKTPSRSAFQCRKFFHSIEKKPNEELDQWLCRIQTAIVGCDFDVFTEFMLIEKFISGLCEKTFEKFTNTKTLAEEQLLRIYGSNIASLNPIELSGSFTDKEFDSIEKIDELLSLEIVERNDEADLDEGELQSIDEKNEADFSQHKKANATIKSCTKSADEHVQQKLKGFQINEQNRIVCLDCDKVFALKSSYNVHKRM